MSSNKKLVADLLFGVQIVGAFALAGSQFFRLLRTVQGQSLSMFLLIEAYLLLHVLLSYSAHRARASRVTGQTLFIYVLWIALIAANIGAVLWNGRYRWGVNDTVTVVLALGGTITVFGVSRFRGLPFSDPVPKGLLAMVFKGLPQWMLAIKVADEGGAGLPGLAVLAGNATILTRLWQIALTIREAGWDRNRVWLFASEAINELSWATVSVVWMLWRFSH